MFAIHRLVIHTGKVMKNKYLPVDQYIYHGVEQGLFSQTRLLVLFFFKEQICTHNLQINYRTLLQRICF